MGLARFGLELDPLSPLPSRDPRWFIPAHGVRSFRTANLRERETATAHSEGDVRHSARQWKKSPGTSVLQPEYERQSDTAHGWLQLWRRAVRGH